MIAPYFKYDSLNKVIFISSNKIECETKSKAVDAAFKYYFELREYGYNLQIMI